MFGAQRSPFPTVLYYSFIHSLTAYIEPPFCAKNADRLMGGSREHSAGGPQPHAAQKFSLEAFAPGSDYGRVVIRPLTPPASVSPGSLQSGAFYIPAHGSGLPQFHS